MFDFSIRLPRTDDDPSALVLDGSKGEMFARLTFANQPTADVRALCLSLLSAWADDVQDEEYSPVALTDVGPQLEWSRLKNGQWCCELGWDWDELTDVDEMVVVMSHAPFFALAELLMTAGPSLPGLLSLDVGTGNDWPELANGEPAYVDRLTPVVY